MAQYRRIWDTYRFPGFRPEQTVCGIFGNPRARVIQRRAYGLRDQECLLLKVPNLHVAGVVSPKNYPLDWEKTQKRYCNFISSDVYSL